MKRKLVRQGAATMMISLPTKWIKQNKLEKGSEVNLEEKGEELIINAGDKAPKKSIELNINSLVESSVRTVLINAYRLGYDKIKINYNGKDAIKVISHIVDRHTIGFEITKKGENFCEIENITEPSKDQFDNIFSKILLNIDEIFEITEKMLKGEKLEFHEQEEKILQYANFCRRVIAKNSFEDYALKWAFHAEMIHGQRELYHMLKYLEKNKIKPEKEVFDLLDECKKMFELLKQAHKEKDLVKIEKIHEIEKEITYKKGYLILNKTKNPIIIHHILKSIRSFYLASSPLAGINI